MGQFPSSTDNIPHQKISSISSFSRPSFLLPFFQQQQKSRNQFWLENNERKDFEQFAHRIFSYLTADGVLDLPENYSQSTFNSLIQSLMKQLDKYLEYQPIFDKIDQNVIPLIPMLLSPKHIIKTYQTVQEKTQPFMDFILHIYDVIVLPKPTPQNIELFLPLLNQFTSSADVYSPLLTTLLSNITSILLCDNSSSQKLCQILIQHLSNKQFSIYYIMAFIDAILTKPSISTRVISELKADLTKAITYKPVNANIVRMRARLGENAIVQTACHYKQQSFILTNENQLFKVSIKAVKLLQIEKIASPARLAVNRCFLYIFQYPSKITIYDQTNHLSKTGSLSYKIPPMCELESVCTYGDKELFLLLFHLKETNSYQLDFLDQTQVTIAQLEFKTPPICMAVSHNFLKIATNKKLHFFEIDFDNFKIAPMVPCVINKPREWKLLSMQEETFFVMKPARNHLQLAYLKQKSPLSFLPEIGETYVPKDVIDYLLKDLIVKLSDVIWNMISEHSSAQDLSQYKINEHFIGYLVDLVKKAVNSQCDVETLDHIVFVVLALLVIHFNDDKAIDEKNGELIIEVLTTVSKASSICWKSNILLPLFLMIDHCFSFLFQNNQDKLIEIAKSICSNQQGKEHFTLFLPLLVSSPSILYLLDVDNIRILYQNSSPYTCLFLIQNSVQMLISEYIRCSKNNLDTSRLLITLKALTESTREYFPKEIILMTFTLFLKTLDEMKQTTLIVTFLEYIHPIMEYFDKKFDPDLIFCSGNDDIFPINEQTIETKHPVGNDNKYCWDISFPGAQSIEVEFDPSCSILIDDQDVFQILAGCSATSPIVYEREPKSIEPFPKKLYINSSSARVIFKSFAGYNLHGLKMTFRKIGNSSRNNEKVIDSYQFYIYYFFHCVGNCISTVFEENVENPKMNCCQFMLWMKKIEMPSNSLNKTQQVCRMVPDSFMNMMLNETKAMQRTKVTPEIQEIEMLCVSATLHQLEITETVLNSKKFDEPNLSATTKKFSTLMLPHSPYAGNSKKIRPTIIVPTNTIGAHTNQFLRQSLMTPKESQRMPSNTTMSTSEKVNSFLKKLWKLIYQMRTRIHYAKQQSKTQYETQLKTIKDKAKYFASVRSVFEPVSNYDSLQVLQTRASQILRVISSDFSLDEMFIYVKEHIQFQINQASMIKQLEKFANEISHQHILMQIFYPLCKRLMATPKISFPATTSAAFQLLFQNLSKHFMHVDTHPDNSFQLMTLLSNFALVGFNESQSDAIFEAIKTFIDHNQNTIAWQLFLHYAMNVSTQLFEEKAKYFFESGIVGPTLLLQTLLILDKGNSVTNLSFVSSFINSKQPNLIQSIFLFLSAYYGKFGIQEDFTIKIENKTMESEAFFRYLLKMLGEKASGKPISLLPKDMPIESHMMIYSEITSFFRICIKKTSKVNDYLLRLFDTILLDFSKDIVDESIIGVFIVLGEGFFSLKSNSYAIHDKASSVMKLEEYSMYIDHAKLKSLLNDSISQIDTKRIIGYPRIPPNPSDFPMTKFRMNIITTIARQYKEINPVLFAAFSLYLNVLFQDQKSIEMIISSFSSSNEINSTSFELVKLLLSIANESSYEGQYHSLPELLESAATYQYDSNEREKLNKLIKLNSNVKTGNVLIDHPSYYYEFTLLDDIKTTDLMIGFISDDCTSNYHSFAALDIQKKCIVLNGIVLRDSIMPIVFSKSQTIGCLFSNNSVSFIFNNKTLIPSNIPLSCHLYTPLIISSNTELNYKINFGDHGFIYSIPSYQSEYEIINVQYHVPKSNKTFDSNDLDDENYLSFLNENNPVSKNQNEIGEFKQADFAKPYFACHKEMIHSKSEVCNYLDNVNGQPFLINSSFNPFDKKIGHLEKIGENRKFTLKILDAEIGKIHTIDFDESVLQKLTFHYFPKPHSSQVFRCLSIRVIRYAVLLIFNSFPNLYLDNEIIDHSIMSEYLSKMICELIPESKEIKRTMPNKGNESIFVSTLMFNSIISIPFYRNQLLNMFDRIIAKEKSIEEPTHVESNNIISSRHLKKRKQEKSQPGIISDLYRKLIQQIRVLNSPSFYISEFNFLIETTHPLSYFRIDRTISSHEATRFLIIANPAFYIESRGLLIKSQIKSFLVNASNDIESLISGNEIELNLSNNKLTNQYGCKMNIIPQFQYSCDSTFMPLSFLLHFGTNLLKITANKFLPSYEINNQLIPLLILYNNPMLKVFRYQFLSPILFTNQKLNDDKLYELCLPFLSHFDSKFSILNINAQEEAIMLITSFVRLQATKFTEITKRQMKTNRKINQANISLANNFSEFRKLMKSGHDFIKTLGHKRLEFVMYLLPFLRVETLSPYFLFYKHYFEGSSSNYLIETQNSSMSQLLGLTSATQIESENKEIEQMYKNKYLYHLKFDGSKNQKIKFSDSFESIPSNLSVSFTSPKDQNLNIEVNSSTDIKQPDFDSSDRNLHVHSDDFYIEIKSNSSESAKIPTIKMKIIPTIEDAQFPPQLVSAFLPQFLSDISLMNQMWLPHFDSYLSPHIKSSNILASLPPTSLISLNMFPDNLIKSRFSFIKQLNELFNGELSQLPLNDNSQPLVNLLLNASSAFSSAMKLSRIEKLICKNFKQKKSFSFNRSRALIAKTTPDSPEGKSLFDQVIDQIPINSLSLLKCKDAPWRVTLEGEGATDVGGPGRDLFTEISSELCMKHNHLFILTPRCIFDNQIEEYVPDPRCHDVDRFVYVGAFVALAFVTRLQQPYQFADLIWSFLSGDKVSLNHIYTADPSFKTLITSTKKGEITGDDMKYTVKNIFGEDVELIPNGASTNVLSGNPNERQNELNKYCELAIQFRISEFNPQLKKMKEGFSIFLGDICNQLVTGDELKSYICGSVDIPIQELRQLIQTTNATPEEEEMLYEVLEEFSVAERMLFIKFATGKMSVPAPGASWNGSLNVEFVKLKPKKPPYRLPIAATCSSTVSIPRYPSKEILASKLRTAITYGSDIVLDHAFDASGIIQ